SEVRDGFPAERDGMLQRIAGLEKHLPSRHLDDRITRGRPSWASTSPTSPTTAGQGYALANSPGSSANAAMAARIARRAHCNAARARRRRAVAAFANSCCARGGQGPEREASRMSAFERYIASGARRTGFWRVLLGTVVIGLFWVGGTMGVLYIWGLLNVVR